MLKIRKGTEFQTRTNLFVILGKIVTKTKEIMWKVRVSISGRKRKKFARKKIEFMNDEQVTSIRIRSRLFAMNVLKDNHLPPRKHTLKFSIPSPSDSLLGRARRTIPRLGIA